jgi:hypothetical protein
MRSRVWTSWDRLLVAVVTIISSVKDCGICSYAQLCLNLRQPISCCCLDNKFKRRRNIFFHHGLSAFRQWNICQLKREPWTLILSARSVRRNIAISDMLYIYSFQQGFVWLLYCRVGLSFISGTAMGGFVLMSPLAWHHLRLPDWHGSLESMFRNLTCDVRVIFKASCSATIKFNPLKTKRICLM